MTPEESGRAAPGPPEPAPQEPAPGGDAPATAPERRAPRPRGVAQSAAIPPQQPRPATAGSRPPTPADREDREDREDRKNREARGARETAVAEAPAPSSPSASQPSAPQPPVSQSPASTPAPTPVLRRALVHGAAVLLVLASLGWVSVYGFVEPWIALAFGVLVALGELARTALPGERDQAPLGAAGALGYALLGSLAGARTHHGVGQVVLVCTGAALVGTVPSLLGGRRPNWDSAARRVLCVAVAASLFQPFYNRGVLLRHGLEHGPGYAAYIAACAALSAAVDVGLAALLSGTPLRRALRDETTALLRIGSAVAATGVVIAIAAGEIGLWALPLFSVPLLLTQAGFRRYAAIRATQRQTIASLARATEVAGYTLPGHALRVSALARDLGRELALSDHDLLLLEYAALMHDIGQLSLVDPIPGGATALLDDAEQLRIGRLGSEVIRRTGVPPQVAEIVARAAQPYRRSDGSIDGEVPVAARIIRVANAYDDLACDDPGPARRAEVLDQLRAGTERDFEPRVVEALARIRPRISG